MDQPERRRWDAGKSAFWSDRVKFHNSLPAGGRTSGNDLRLFQLFLQNSAELSRFRGLF
jgi:hypothetical protein